MHWLIWPFVLAVASGLVRTRITVHRAELFRLKCDMLPFRSLVDGNDCYFAVVGKFPVSLGSRVCRSIFAGSDIYTDDLAGSMLSRLQLERSAFHTNLFSPEEKGLLCAYENPFSCKSDERPELPGRCMYRADRKMTFTEARQFCADRGMILPLVTNDEENGALTAVLIGEKSPAWIDQSVKEDRWSMNTTEKISYFRWFFGSGPPTVRCPGNQAATVTSYNQGNCIRYAGWEPSNWDDTRVVICVRPSDSDLHPAFAQPTTTTTTTTTTTRRPTTTTTPRPTTTTSTTTTTTPKPTTTTKPPDNVPPRPEWMLTLKYYYNPGRILHAFAADSAGWNKIMYNGIGYNWNDGSGESGKSLMEDKIGELAKICGAAHRLRKLYFNKWGNAYYYAFGSGEVFGGWVATEVGTCGARYPKYQYSCLVSADIMYAESLESNTWYRGRWDRNEPQIKFVLW